MSVKKGSVLLAGFLIYCSCAFGASTAPIEEPRAAFMTVELSEIEELGVNHQQGSIGFTVEGIQYFYYVRAQERAEKIIAVSSVLNDLRSAKRIKIKHEPYGLHRKITNLLIVFERVGE